MKEEYVHPTVLNADTMETTSVELKDSVFPIALTISAVAAAKEAMKATPSMPLSAINKR